MGFYKEIQGDLIKLAKQGNFDIIAQGCNCQNTMGKGIAVGMKESFSCDKFPLEQRKYRGNYNKLGQIDFEVVHRTKGTILQSIEDIILLENFNPEDSIVVVNCYIQFNLGKNLDYLALNLCLRKINFEFKGRHIGLPHIGCGIGGGNFKFVKAIIKKELKDMDVTIVKFK